MQSCFWPRALIHVRVSEAVTDQPWLRDVLDDIAGAYRLVDPANVLVDVTHGQVARGSPAQLARDLLNRLQRAAPHLSFRLACAADPMAAACVVAVTPPGTVDALAPWQTKERLGALTLAELAASYPRLAATMGVAGLRQCGDVLKLSRTLVQRYMGSDGLRLWYLCRHGRGDTTVEMEVSHDRIRFRVILPPKTRGSRALTAHLRRLHLEVARVLRRRRRVAHAAELRARLGQGQSASVFHIPASVSPAGFLPDVKVSQFPGLVGGRICQELEMELSDLRGPGPQLELFADEVGKAADFETPASISPVEMCVR